MRQWSSKTYSLNIKEDLTIGLRAQFGTSHLGRTNMTDLDQSILFTDLVIIIAQVLFARGHLKFVGGGRANFPNDKCDIDLGSKGGIQLVRTH